MKATKALKKLTNIEAVMSDITRGYLPNAPHLSEVLEDATIAITRAKEALSSQVAEKLDRGARKALPAPRKAAVKNRPAKKAAEKATVAKLANKSIRIKKAAK